MKEFVKKITAVLLATCMIFALAACGDSGTQKDVSETLAGAEIEVVIPSHPNWPYRDDWKSWQYVREATGADIDVVAYPNSDYSTKASLIMADPENVPDLMCMPDMSYVSKYVSQGAFVAIDDYLDEMPNYTKFWDSVPEEEAESMLKMRRAVDGKTYYPQVYGRQNTINLRTWLYRKDIFEKHNIKMPETMDDLYLAAKQLKALYPDSFPICIRVTLVAVRLAETLFYNPDNDCIGYKCACLNKFFGFKSHFCAVLDRRADDRSGRDGRNTKSCRETIRLRAFSGAGSTKKNYFHLYYLEGSLY